MLNFHSVASDLISFNSIKLLFFETLAAAQQLKPTQADPCQAKGKMVADVTYCDRYWECIEGVAEQFDCPNGLVFAGRARGLLENCDYPWRGDSCEGKQLASKCKFNFMLPIA